jgi:LysM repeat protein
MQQPQVKPYVLIAIIILAILMAFGVFLTLMYLQRRPPDNSYVVNVEGQEIVVNPVPESEVIIVPQGGETIIVEPQPTVGPPVQIVTTNTPEPLPQPTITPVPPTAVPDISMYIFTNHTVVGSDTLYSLASLYNTSIPLMARFGISSTEIVVGNVLSIPVGNPAYCPGYRPYVVLKGDTPFGLSSSAGLTLEEFGRISKLDANYSIYETQVVCIP